MIFLSSIINEFKMPNREEPYFDDGGPLIFEQYVRADLKNIKMERDQMSQRYGKCRIAKLQFILP